MRPSHNAIRRFGQDCCITGGGEEVVPRPCEPHQKQNEVATQRTTDQAVCKASCLRALFFDKGLEVRTPKIPSRLLLQA